MRGPESYKIHRDFRLSLFEPFFFAFFTSLFSTFLTWLVAVPLGVWSALRRGEWPDKTISVIAFVGILTLKETKGKVLD